MATPLILIVDDDRDIRQSLQDALVDEGYAVAAAADGLEALDYLANNPTPSLILLDWMMPRCDGPTFRARQRELPSADRVPVVLLTADTRIDHKVHSLEAACYVSKPVRLEALLDVIVQHALPAGA